MGEFGVFLRDPEQELELRSFIAHATPEMQLLDIGSHWGVFTLAALHFGGSRAQAICIEASADAAKVLQDNLALNSVTGRVRVVNAACGAEVGELQMLTTGAGGADYFVVPAEKRPDTITVPQITVDHVCEQNDFQPTHVKVDVEGFEEEVFVGARTILRTCRPILFVELHGELISRRGKQATTVLALLEKYGYTRWKFSDGASAGPDDFAKRNNNVRFIALPNSSSPHHALS